MSRDKKKTGMTSGGSLWRPAAHPGYKNPKEAARGGTRREIARARIAAAVEEKLTRQRDREAAERAEEIKQAALDRQRARQEAAAERQRVREAKAQEKERKLTARHLRDQQKQAKAAVKAAKAAAREAKAARRRRLCLPARAGVAGRGGRRRRVPRRCVSGARTWTTARCGTVRGRAWTSTVGL